MSAEVSVHIIQMVQNYAHFGKLIKEDPFPNMLNYNYIMLSYT